jgi:hypothetical protein
MIMKKENVTIPFESEQLAALEFSLKKKSTSVQAQLEELLKCLYESEVPEPVREYLDSRAAPTARPRRPARPAKPQPREESPSALTQPAGERAGG